MSIYISLHRKSIIIVNTERNNLLYEFFSEDENQSLRSSSYAKYGYGFLVLGLLIAYLSWAGYIGHFILLGVAFVLTGFVLIRKKLNDFFSFGESEFPDDEKIVSMFFDDVNIRISERAFKLFGIEKDNTEFIGEFNYYFPGHKNYPRINPEKNVKKQLDDETYMFSFWQIHKFVLTENFLTYYSCMYNWIDNEIFDELSNEFYISDIATVKTEFINRENEETIGEEIIRPKPIKKFIISNISGDKIEFLIEESALLLPGEFENDIENLMKEIRLLIRKKRFPEKDNYSSDSVDFEIEDTRKSDDI